MILDVLHMMTNHLPVLIHFHCVRPDHPDAPMLADCAEAFGQVVRDSASPSFCSIPARSSRSICSPPCSLTPTVPSTSSVMFRSVS